MLESNGSELQHGREGAEKRVGFIVLASDVGFSLMASMESHLIEHLSHTRISAEGGGFHNRSVSTM